VLYDPANSAVDVLVKRACTRAGAQVKVTLPTEMLVDMSGVAAAAPVMASAPCGQRGMGTDSATRPIMMAAAAVLVATLAAAASALLLMWRAQWWAARNGLPRTSSASVAVIAAAALSLLLLCTPCPSPEP
jgi:hypothetical protein